MPTKQKKAGSFTLLEILVTLALLSIVLTGIGINIPVLLRHERFESGVERVMDEIAFANELMVIYQTDVSLTLMAEGDGVVISYDIASMEVKRIFKNKVGKDLFIKGIESLCFMGGEKNHLILKFCADEYLTPHGELTFACKGKEKKVLLNYEKIKEKAFPTL